MNHFITSVFVVPRNRQLGQSRHSYYPIHRWSGWKFSLHVCYYCIERIQEVSLTHVSYACAGLRLSPT